MSQRPGSVTRSPIGPTVSPGNEPIPGGPMTDTVDHVRTRLDGALVEDPSTGRYQVRRDVFTDEELFELEMKYIFEGNWVYLAHESQLPNPGDYFTTYIGRQPVVITRGKEGELNCLINA